MKRKSEETLALTIVAILAVIGCMVLGGMIVHAIAADLPICPPYWKCTPRADWNDPNCSCWNDAHKAAHQQKTPLPKSRPPAQSDRAAGMP